MSIVIKNTEYKVLHAKDVQGNNATEITVFKNNKKAKIKIFAGADNTYNDNDKIVIKGDEEVTNISKTFLLTILKQLNGINNHEDLRNTKLKDPKDAKTVNPFNLNPENIAEPTTFKGLIEELDGTATEARKDPEITIDKDSIKALGFNEDEAKNIVEFLENNNFDDTTKELVINALKKLKSGTNKADEIKREIKSYMGAIKKNIGDKTAAEEAASFVKRKLDGWTSEKDGKAIVDKINTLTPLNVISFLTSYDTENMDKLFEDLYDDCKDDAGIIKYSSRKILELLNQHVGSKSGELQELYRKADNAIKKLENHEEGFLGPDDNDAEIALSALKDFAKKAKEVTNTKREKELEDARKKLESAIK